jgi:CheY-like chemotaxis protein
VEDPSATETALPATRPLLLLAEDQDVNALVVQKMLARIGLDSERARDGREAVDMFEPSRHAAVILDLQMPRLDGLGAARELRARPDGRAVPILALSAHCSPAIAGQCLEAGMNDALQKPCTAESLRAALAAFPGLLPPAGAARGALQRPAPSGR